MNVVLFACVHNAGRSQVAAALFNEAADVRGAADSRRRPRPRAQAAPRARLVALRFGRLTTDGGASASRSSAMRSGTMR
jgi:protein-tyrosine-phosphatase